MRTSHSYPLPILSLWVLSFLHIQALQGWAAAAWHDPVPVYAVNTEYHEKAPFLSFDGLTLYFGRQDVLDGEYTRIFRAAPFDPFCPFPTPKAIYALTDLGGHVSSPWVSADNLRMYYYTTSSGKQLMMATRSSTSHPWWPGLEISELNWIGDLVCPTLTEDERTIVFGGYDVPGGRGDYDLWMAERSSRNARFGRPWNLGTLNTWTADVHPSLTPDGLTLYFMSRRNGRSQIFVARRTSRSATFGPPEHLAVFDTPNGASEFPSISADGKALYFGRWPDGGDMDIYVSYAGCTYYVDAVHGSDANNGRTHQTAFATIQKAINASLDGDEVLLCPGVHRGSIRFLGKAITLRSAGDAAIIEAPGRTAVTFDMGEGKDTVLRNIIIRNSRTGILCSRSSPTIANITVTGNTYGADAYGFVGSWMEPGPSISNGILWANVESDVSGFDVTYCCVQQFAIGHTTFGGDRLLGPGNFAEDPLFVDAENGDYHLRSNRGRYWPEHDMWVVDDVTSLCIDAGDPAADFSAERGPNGDRLNIGAHGGTPYAEMSEPPFSGDINGDGLFDDVDFDLFMDLWEQHTQPPTPAKRR